MEITIGDDDGVIVTHERGYVRIESFGSGILSQFETRMVIDAIDLVSKYLEEADVSFDDESSTNLEFEVNKLMEIMDGN